VRRNVHRLTQTYLTLSLAHIAESVELADAAEAERYIVSMVSHGEISAEIDEGAGMVQFTQWDERFDSLSAVTSMETKITQAIALAQKLFEMNSQLAVDPNYLARAARERQARWDDEAMDTTGRALQRR